MEASGVVTKSFSDLFIVIVLQIPGRNSHDGNILRHVLDNGRACADDRSPADPDTLPDRCSHSNMRAVAHNDCAR